MQQKIHPGLAAGIILVFLGIVSFILYWPNRPRPVPNHFGPMSLGQAQAMQMHGGAPQQATPPVNSGIKSGAKPKPPNAKAKDSKPAEKK